MLLDVLNRALHVELTVVIHSLHVGTEYGVHVHERAGTPLDSYLRRARWIHLIVVGSGSSEALLLGTRPAELAGPSAFKRQHQQDDAEVYGVLRVSTSISSTCAPYKYGAHESRILSNRWSEECQHAELSTPTSPIDLSYLASRNQGECKEQP